MSEITQGSINEAVIIKDGEVLTSSRSIAYVFGKPHKSVLRVVNIVKKEGQHTSVPPQYSKEIKFYNSTYIHPQNHQQYRRVLMNRRAFLNVVMTFRGPNVFILRNMFFDAFDNMEYQLRNIKPSMNKLKDRSQELLQSKVDTLEPRLHQEKHLNWYEEQTVKALKPASDAYHREMSSPYVYPLSNLAERYGTDAMTMNLVLQKIGLIGKKGGRWYLTKNFRDYPYASHDLTYVGEHGSGTDSGALKWTQKGFELIRNMLKWHFNVTELHQMGNEFNNTFLLTRKNGKLQVVKLTAEQLSIEMKHRNGSED